MFRKTNVVVLSKFDFLPYSNFDRDRVGLLLVETPMAGATVLARRLEDHLSHFLTSTGELTSAVNVRIEIASYPDDSSSIEQMLKDFAS